ncbi:hypothetical protein Droror1_Dr00014775 [Drosera rotundifolia]
MNKLSYRALLLGNTKSCSTYMRPTVLRYKSHVRDHRGEKHGDEEHVRERAPSTAEVLQEMMEEKERLRKMLEEKERQGVVSQDVGEDQEDIHAGISRIPDQNDADDGVRTHL